MRRMAGAVGALLVVLVGVTACGGDDDAPASGEVAESATQSDDAAPADSAVGDVGAAEQSPQAGGAKVELAGATYEFTDGSCTVTAGGDVVSQFFDGDDDLNVTLVNRSGLVRATLDGELWVNTGEVGEPDVADTGDVTWSGELQKENVPDSATVATITLSC